MNRIIPGVFDKTEPADIYNLQVAQDWIEKAIAGTLTGDQKISTASLTEDLDLTGNVVLGSASTDTLQVNASIVANADSKGLVMTAVGIDRAIDIQITPTTVDRQLYMVIDYGTSAKEAAYITAKSGNNSGEVIAVRGRAEQQHASASGGEARGGYFQGVSVAALWAGTVTGVFGNAIAKTTSTVTTIRGGFFEAESEGTPTAITNLYGTHTRVKTTVAPGTDFIGSLIETQKMGGGIKMDSMLAFKTTTWANTEEAMDAIIDMSAVVGKADCHIRFGTGFQAKETTTEGDFWYDTAAHTLQYYDGSNVKTVTSS